MHLKAETVLNRAYTNHTTIVGAGAWTSFQEPWTGEIVSRFAGCAQKVCSPFCYSQALQLCNIAWICLNLIQHKTQNQMGAFRAECTFSKPSFQFPAQSQNGSKRHSDIGVLFGTWNKCRHAICCEQSERAALRTALSFSIRGTQRGQRGGPWPGGQHIEGRHGFLRWGWVKYSIMFC